MSTETTRNPTDPDLAEIMSRLADGDMDAMGDLKERFGHRIRGVVQRIVRKTGRRDILNDPDEIEGLTMDAILIVVGYAGTWKPWGALPWPWAYKASEEVGSLKPMWPFEPIPSNWMSIPPAWRISSSCCLHFSPSSGPSLGGK